MTTVYHELADLRFDLNELDIELQKARDNLSLLQNSVALMLESIDDIVDNNLK